MVVLAVVFAILGGLIAFGCGLGAWLILDVGLPGAFLIYLAVGFGFALIFLIGSLVIYIASNRGGAGETKAGYRMSKGNKEYAATDSRG